MLDKELIKTKIELIQRDLERLQELKAYTIDEISGDFYKWSTLKLVLVEIIGRAIDVNSHTIAELGDLKEKAPETSAETFLRMGEMNILPKDFAQKVSESAGFRNKIVHEYNNLLEDKIYETVEEALAQYTMYCAYILKFIENYEK
ncbi:MAG: hypothetical protein A3J63_02015 [Candidatus Moranbacteria bacterium RIFCSPHIGHO2_02_FULL_40_12b]|nr:MAG: hypothetical protein A3J63_02015 [Candidatus Moranbacteria bacterium RIFCSPHIGHO2_02_FULL_40_12b]